MEVGKCGHMPPQAAVDGRLKASSRWKLGRREQQQRVGVAGEECRRMQEAIVRWRGWGCRTMQKAVLKCKGWKCEMTRVGVVMRRSRGVADVRNDA